MQSKKPFKNQNYYRNSQVQKRKIQLANRWTVFRIIRDKLNMKKQAIIRKMNFLKSWVIISNTHHICKSKLTYSWTSILDIYGKFEEVKNERKRAFKEKYYGNILNYQVKCHMQRYGKTIQQRDTIRIQECAVFFSNAIDSMLVERSK